MLGVAATIVLSHAARPFAVLEDHLGIVAWLMPFALVGIPATFMGGTLPVLAKAVSPEAGGVARAGGRLYAANTAGAIAGALLVPFALVPAFGVRGSAIVAAALNLAAAAGARALGLQSHNVEGSQSQETARSKGLGARRSEDETVARSQRSQGPRIEGSGERAVDVRGCRWHFARVRGRLVTSDRAVREHTRLCIQHRARDVSRRPGDRQRTLCASGRPRAGSVGHLRRADCQRWFGRTAARRRPWLLRSWHGSRTWRKRCGPRPPASWRRCAPASLSQPSPWCSCQRFCSGPRSRRRSAWAQPPIGWGTMSGRVLALNTAGGIVGTLATGFVLLPALGIVRTLGALAVGAAALGLVAAFRENSVARHPRVVIIAIASHHTADCAGDAARSDRATAHVDRGGTLVSYAESPGGTVAVVEQAGGADAFRRLYIQAASNSGDVLRVSTLHAAAGVATAARAIAATHVTRLSSGLARA